MMGNHTRIAVNVAKADFKVVVSDRDCRRGPHDWRTDGQEIWLRAFVRRDGFLRTTQRMPARWPLSSSSRQCGAP